MNLSLASALGRDHAVYANNHNVSRISGEDEASGTSSEFASAGSKAIAVEEVGLRHLKTLSEIEQILHLREAIDLSVHSAAGSDFRTLEKKETSAVSSVPSN